VKSADCPLETFIENENSWRRFLKNKKKHPPRGEQVSKMSKK
jgi:hypothetical protein